MVFSIWFVVVYVLGVVEVIMVIWFDVVLVVLLEMGLFIYRMFCCVRCVFSVID